MTSESYEDVTGESGESESGSVGRRRFLRAGTGAAVAAVGLSAASGVAAAHFHGPEKRALDVDINPGNRGSKVNLGEDDTIPVAVLQTDEFDPTTENVNYRFGAQDVVENGGGARPVHDGRATDVDDDGRCDLVLRFPVADTGFDGNESIGHLHWEKGERGAGHGLGGSDGITFAGSEHQSSQSGSGNRDLGSLGAIIAQLFGV